MTLKFCRFRAVVREHVHATFVELSAAVHEVSGVHAENKNSAKTNTVCRYRADSTVIIIIDFSML